MMSILTRMVTAAAEGRGPCRAAAEALDDAGVLDEDVARRQPPRRDGQQGSDGGGEALSVAAQVEPESKFEANLMAVYHIVVSGAWFQAVSTWV